MDADVSRGVEMTSTAKQEECASHTISDKNRKHPKFLDKAVGPSGPNKPIRTGLVCNERRE